MLRIAYILLSGLLIVGCASTESNINSGLWHYSAGLYGQAIPRLLESTPKFEKNHPADERVSRSYLALGVMAEDSKRYDKSEFYLLKALETAKTTQPFSNLILRNAESTLGHFYLNRERYSDALLHLETAETISKSSQSNPILNAIDLDNVAIALQGIGKLDESINYSEKALSVAEKNSTSEMYTLTKGIILYNLGKAYEDSKRQEKAKHFYIQSIELLTIVVEKNTYEQWRLDTVQNALNNLDS